MEKSSKNRSLIAIIIFLLLSNIAILVFFLFLNNSRKPTGHERTGGITSFIQKDMGFNEKQMHDYDTLRKNHMDNARPIFQAVRNAKDSFYNLLYSEDPDSIINKSAAVIGERQIQLDIYMFRYFKKIRSLCTSEQLPKFDSLIKKVVEERITGDHQRRQDHKK